MDSYIFLAYALIIGLCVGSFLNVLIYRLPVMMENSWQQESREILEMEAEPEPARFNLLKPDSHCPSCKTAIKWWHNIPVISYIFLRGQCSSCKTKISLRYPIIELTTGLLTLVVALQFSSLLGIISVSILVWGIIALVMIDYDTYLLPDSLTLPLLWMGLVVNSISGFVSLQDAVYGAIAGYLSLWCIYWLFKLLTGKEGMGAGDFKLLACIGAWLGWQSLPTAILISAGVGSIIGITLMALTQRKSDQAIPFGPFLGLAFLILLLGKDYIDYLRSLIGF